MEECVKEKRKEERGVARKEREGEWQKREAKRRAWRWLYLNQKKKVDTGSVKWDGRVTLFSFLSMGERVNESDRQRVKEKVKDQVEGMNKWFIRDDRGVKSWRVEQWTVNSERRIWKTKNCSNIARESQGTVCSWQRVCSWLCQHTLAKTKAKTKTEMVPVCGQRAGSG